MVPLFVPGAVREIEVLAPGHHAQVNPAGQPLGHKAVKVSYYEWGLYCNCVYSAQHVRNIKKKIEAKILKVKFTLLKSLSNNSEVLII